MVPYDNKKNKTDGCDGEMNKECIENFATITSKLNTIIDHCAETNKILKGNGTPGLILEVDRLKQDNMRTKKHKQLIGIPLIVAVCVLLLNAGWNKIQNSPLPQLQQTTQPSDHK